jgi:hypothetical protein
LFRLYVPKAVKWYSLVGFSPTTSRSSGADSVVELRERKGDG